MAPPSSSEPIVSAEPAPPPPVSAPLPAAKVPKGKFVSLALSAKSGKVDKIGSKDGAFGPDGVNDVVLDAEIEGAAVAFMIASTDAEGHPDGKFTADTFVGTQLPPSEAGAEVKPGLGTAGIGVYENDKLANAADGSLTQLSAGTHELTLYVSSREAPKKGSYKAFVVFDDRSMVASAVVTVK